MNAKPGGVGNTNSCPSRAELAEAIASRTDLERQLSAARDAADKAMRARWAAQRKLDAVRAARDEAAAAQSTGARFIASVAAGEPCGADELERQASTADIDAAERELATWAQTQAECEATIPLREQDISMADLRVERLAHEVVETSGVVSPLLDGLEAMFDELDRRLAMLHFLDIRDMISDAERPEVDRSISRMKRGHDYQHPSYSEWRTAVDALMRDAGAELPRK